MPGLFITGTDTGVGKTVVTAALFSHWSRQFDCIPMKPIHTGTRLVRNTLTAPDLEFILRSARYKLPLSLTLADLAPYRFRPACSPHLAARLSHRKIGISRIKAIATKLEQTHGFVIVEGAGGILVPISKTKAMLDVIHALGYPVLLVARPYLGTLNHTLLSVHALREAGVRIVGIVLNSLQPSAWGIIERDNQRTLSDKTDLPVLRFPYCPSARHRRLSPADLRKVRTFAQSVQVLLSRANSRSRTS